MFPNHMSVINDFLDFPEERLEEALDKNFKTYNDNGAIFPGIGMTQHIEDLSKLKIGINFSGAKCVNFFRLTLEKDILPTFIHTDESMAELTGILYLNKNIPEGAGTRFWKHKETGLYKTEAWDITPENLKLQEQLQREGLIEDAWEPVYTVAARFNRLVLFDSKLFHSPWPRAGWGNSVENGRLIQVYFIDLNLKKSSAPPEDVF